MARRTTEIESLVEHAHYIHDKLGAIQWPEGAQSSVHTAQIRCIRLAEALRVCLVSTMICGEAAGENHEG